MQQIFNFLIKNRNLLLYILLVVTGLTFTIQNHSYHRNSFIHSTGAFTGYFLDKQTSVSSYFSLDEENAKLREENAKLRMLVGDQSDSLLNNTIVFYNVKKSPFEVFPARVIKNRYAYRDNFLTIDIGEQEGIEEDMGVITTNGILGVIDKVGARYSRVISVLNSEISLNAQIKGTNTIGSLTWDGSSPYMMNLEDVPRLAKVVKGDTIITGQQSATFPPDIMIGVVKEALLIDNGNRYKIDVELFNDMTNVGTAYVIRNRDLQEIQEIDNLEEDE